MTNPLRIYTIAIEPPLGWLCQKNTNLHYRTNPACTYTIAIEPPQIVKEETRCRHMGYSLRLTARVLLYAPSHRQNCTHHGLCDTSRGALAGTRNSSMGPTPRRIDQVILQVIWKKKKKKKIIVQTNLQLGMCVELVEEVHHGLGGKEGRAHDHVFVAARLPATELTTGPLPLNPGGGDLLQLKRTTQHG